MADGQNRRTDIGSYEREMSIDYIRSRVTYDAAAGTFTWNHWPGACRGWNSRFVGTLAGCRTGCYIIIKIDGRPLRAHRLAWVISHGAIPEHMRIDHINGDGCDNRLANLRLATQSQNQINWTRIRPNGLPRGVHYYRPRNTYVARVYQKGRVYYFGYHATAELAEAAYKVGLERLHGEFVPWRSPDAS